MKWSTSGDRPESILDVAWLPGWQEAKGHTRCPWAPVAHTALSPERLHQSSSALRKSCNAQLVQMMTITAGKKSSLLLSCAACCDPALWAKQPWVLCWDGFWVPATHSVVHPSCFTSVCQRPIFLKERLLLPDAGCLPLMVVVGANFWGQSLCPLPSLLRWAQSILLALGASASKCFVLGSARPHLTVAGLLCIPWNTHPSDSTFQGFKILHDWALLKSKVNILCTFVHFI